MANTIEAIPEKTRWEIATKGLTGAYIAISNALKQAVGQKKFEEPVATVSAFLTVGFSLTRGISAPPRFDEGRKRFWPPWF
jgi:hypothetical protein